MTRPGADPTWDDSADVIVIGAGSAGAVVAARLSEDPHRRVLLLEDGPDHTSAQTPAALQGSGLFAAIFEPGRIHTRLIAVNHPSQPPALYVRGRGAGGSSSINAMIGLRGVPEDYDHWARDLGADGWSWRDLEPWFRRVEDDAEFGDQPGHGRGGPIPLHRLPSAQWSPWDVAVGEAGLALGYPACADYHSPGAVGFGPAALTVRDGVRVSVNDAYLEPARAAATLRVRGDTKVDRILFDGHRACGVRTGDGQRIRAGHVVLSAGVIHSPVILLRSGVANPAIGGNLCEHAAVRVTVALTGAAAERASGARTVSTLLRYTSGLAGAGDADMQMVPFTGIGSTARDDAICALQVALMRVYSRGRVALTSDDPDVEPDVRFALLSDERDLIRLRDGVRRLIDVIRQPAITKVSRRLDGFIPESDFDHPQRWDDWIAGNVGTYVHAAGTCRLGRPDDPAAVVDLNCALIGYQGVSVVDASVLPDLPRANTHLTVVAVAERIAARLRDTLPIGPIEGAREP